MSIRRLNLSAPRHPFLRFVESPEGDLQGAVPGGQETPPAGQNEDPKPAPPAEAPKETQGGLENATPAELLAEIKQLRQENANRRTVARDKASEFDQFRDGLAKALGIKTEEATPEQLQQQLTEAQSKATQHEAAIRERDVQLAVHRIAPTVNANGMRLLDSRSFIDSLAQVDPGDTEAVKTAIQNAVKNDAAFSLTPASAGSHGHQGGGDKPAPKTLDAALSAHYSQ